MLDTEKFFRVSSLASLVNIPNLYIHKLLIEVSESDVMRCLRSNWTKTIFNAINERFLFTYILIQLND